jgi:hypothetical protein
MVWARLLYSNLPTAFQRIKVGSTTILPISGRYKALLRKNFRLNGVPWIY